MGTSLGEGILDEIADSLFIGIIPTQWKEMKVVMIPKTGKDTTRAKAWRPINLINRIGKIGKKEVAGRLQAGGLLHPIQFGSVKRKSGMDAVVRVVTKAQRILARGGGAGAVMEDVKGAFNIVKRGRLIEQLRTTEGGTKWVQWVENFMNERTFSVE